MGPFEMIDTPQTICKEIFITNLPFAFKFNVIMASLVRIYHANLEGQIQADCMLCLIMCLWAVMNLFTISIV